jgi:septum formation protein
MLSGKTHQQNCAVVLARGSEVVWEHVGIAKLTMRVLSPAEIKSYIAADAPLASCGSYKFEELGRHLFGAVEGDHDVVKGLALVPLLAQLHALGVIGLA